MKIFNLLFVTLFSLGLDAANLTGIPSGEFPRDIGKRLILIDEDFAITSTLADSGFVVGGAGTGFGSAINVSPTDQVANHPGIHELVTGTTTTGRAALYSSVFVAMPTSGDLTLEYIVKLDALSDGTDTYAAWIGSHNGTTADPTYGVYFKYDSTTSANWIMGASNSTDTQTASSIAVTTDWTRLKIVANSTEIKYYVNDVLAGTVTTNIPAASTGRGFASLIVKSAGTTSREFWIDNIYSYMKLSSKRY